MSAESQLADWKAKTLAKIHGQPPHRTYTNAEVKQIVYPLLAAAESVLGLCDEADKRFEKREGLSLLLPHKVRRAIADALGGSEPDERNER